MRGSAPATKPSTWRDQIRHYYENSATTAQINYRRPASIFARAKALRENRAKAKLAAHTRHPTFKRLAQQLETLETTALDGIPYILELYSGYGKSASATLQRYFPRAVTITVDNNPDTSPDVLADLRQWNPWRYLLDTDMFRTTSGQVWLPALIWMSTPCGSMCSAASKRGRTKSAPGGFDDDIGAGQANECVESAAQTMLDLAWLQQRGYYGAHCWENPRGTMATRLHSMIRARAVSKKLHVDYCMFGGGADGNPQKSTVLFVSKWMNVAGFKADKSRACDEACRCRKDGSCGGMVASPTPKHYAKEGGVSIVNACVAEQLVASIHRAWQETHGVRRQSYRLSAAAKLTTGLAAPPSVISFLAQRWDDKFGGADTRAGRRPGSVDISAGSDEQRARADESTLEDDELPNAMDDEEGTRAHSRKDNARTTGGPANFPGLVMKSLVEPALTSTRSSSRRPAGRRCVQCDTLISDQRGSITRINGLALCRGCAHSIRETTSPRLTTSSRV